MEVKLTKEQKEALSIDKHISLTANAGSGKTFVLSKRFIKLTVDNNIPVSRIVSITFTDKAASELYKKISDEVEKQIALETDKARHRRLKKVRDEIVSANISTIHSFCTGVLREYAVEAGIDANFNVADNRELDEIRVKKISEIVEKEYSENTDDLKELVRYFGSFKFLEKSLKNNSCNLKIIEKLNETFYNKPDKELVRFYNVTYGNIFDELTSDYDDFISSVLRVATSITSSKFDLTNFIQEIESYRDKKYLLGNYDSFKELMRKICTSKFALLKKVKDKIDESTANFIEQYISNLNSLIPEKCDYTLHEEMLLFARKYWALLLKVVEAINEEKRKNNIIDFDDILILTRRLLKNDYVKNSLSEKYDFIMIDEYQDTNDIQYEIFLPVLDDLKKGNLFVVGDEKQSIYGFRDADLKIFNDTRDIIDDRTSGKGVLQLPHSFRMAPRPAVFINTIFEKLFANPRSYFNEVGYTKLIYSRNDGIEGNVGFLISNNDDISEAEKVALKILNIAEEQNSFESIAVICRKRKYFNELSKEFIKYNIPFNILGGLGFYLSQEIIDIKNILTVIIDPESDVELVGALKSPFFNLDDTSLLKISLEFGKSFFEKLKNYSSKENKVNEIYNKILKFREYAGEPNITLILKKIFVETAYLARIKDKADFKQIEANIKKLFKIANKFNDKLNNTLYDFILYLSDAIENDTDEGEADIDVSENSVNILTIHKSKGLEYKTVIVYGCGESYKGGGSNSTLKLSKEFGVLSKVIDGSPFNSKLVPPVYQLDNYIKDKKEMAEFLRTMYVALTRCMDNLYLSAKAGKNGMKSDSFMGMLSGKCRMNFIDNLEANIESIDGSFKSYEIRFDNKIEENVNNNHVESVEGYEEKEKILEKVNDQSKKEIISATKLSLFYQCPLKYYLTYEVGFNRMIKMFYDSDNKGIMFRDDEDIEGHFDKQGTIIHSFLEKYNDNTDKEELLKSIIEKEIGIERINEKVRENIFLNSKEILENYISSDTYKEIKKFENYKNEFPVYLGLNNFYLFGIIDKLIITDKKAIILDYKTDMVTEKSIDEHLENYRIQLLFYGYLISKIYSDKKIELWLSFLRLPDKIKKLSFEKNHKSEFEKVYSNYLSSIKENSYIKNEKHCYKCPFFINKKCVNDE